MDDIVALKPTIFCGVPRVFQKVYDKILQVKSFMITNLFLHLLFYILKGVQASFWHRRQLFQYAYNTKVEAKRRGKFPSLSLSLSFLCLCVNGGV